MTGVSRLFSLDGKVAVVTGAAQGIGKSIALLFIEAGAQVVFADYDIEPAADAASAAGGASFACKFDLREDQSIVDLFATTFNRFGRVDILINNAGIYPKYSINDVVESQWNEMQRVNVWGCFVALREAARHMRRQGSGGRIVNISSIGAVRTAVNDQVAYNASKAALDSMTLSAALEFAADNILINSVQPGAVRPLAPRPRQGAHTPPSGPLMQPGRMLLGRPAIGDEIAGPVLMLVSAAGSYITGQSLIIDGGFSVS